MSRPALRATAQLLRAQFPALADRIEAVAKGTPVQKPPKHTGGRESDFLYLDLTELEIEEVFEAVADIEVAHAGAATPDSAKLSDIASLTDRWNGAESSRSRLS